MAAVASVPAAVQPLRAGAPNPANELRSPRAMFHVKLFPYRPAAIRFSRKILDAEHVPNMRML